MGSSVHQILQQTFYRASHRTFHRKIPTQIVTSLRRQHMTGGCCLRFLAFSNRSRAPRLASHGLISTMPTAGSTRGKRAPQELDSKKAREAQGEPIKQGKGHSACARLGDKLAVLRSTKRRLSSCAMSASSRILRPSVPGAVSICARPAHTHIQLRI